MYKEKCDLMRLNIETAEGLVLWVDERRGVQSGTDVQHKEFHNVLVL